MTGRLPVCYATNKVGKIRRARNEDRRRQANLTNAAGPAGLDVGGGAGGIVLELWRSLRVQLIGSPEKALLAQRDLRHA